MDERLQTIFKIRPLQTSCIAYRNSTNVYKKFLKQACVSELKNLINVEMKIEEITLKIPEEKQLPNIKEEIKTSKIHRLFKECNVVEESLQYL